MQVKVRGNLDFAGVANSKAAQQSTGQIERCGGSWEAGDLEEQVAHALIAQGNIGIHTAEVDRQSRNTGRTDGAANTGEVVYFNSMGVFGGDKVQVRGRAIQAPGDCTNG